MTKYQKGQGFFQRLATFAIQTCISIEDLEFLLAISYGYIISFLILPAYENSDVNDSVFYLIYRVVSFCRYIFYLDPQVSGNILECFGYIIVLCFQFIVVLYYLLSFLSYMKEKKKSKSISLDEHLNNQSIQMKTLLYFVAYYGEVLGVYLYQRFYELCLNSFNYSLYGKQQIQSQALTYLNSFISLLVLITLLLYYFIRFLVAEECLTINPKNFKKLNTTSTQIICVLIKLLIITLNLSIENKATKFYLNVFLLTLLVASQYKNQLSNLSTLRQRLIQVEFACLATILSSVVILLIFRVMKINQDKKFPVILLLTQLLIYEIMLKIWNQKVLSISISSNMNNHPSKIQFLIAKSIQIHLNRRQDVQILDYLFLSRHRLNCVKVQCTCRKQINYEELMKLYFLEQAMSLNISLSQFKNTTQINSYYLHYVSLLNLIGHTSQAFQQSNNLLLKQSSSNSQQSLVKVARSSLRQSVQRLDSTSQMGSIQSMSQGVDDSQNRFQMLKSNKFSFIESTKLQMLQELIKTEMNKKLLMNAQKQTNNQEDLSHSVNLFLSSEQNNEQIKQKVIKAFQRKIIFFQSLNSTSRISSTQLFNNSKRVATQLLNLELNLNQLYQQFPSQKIQSVNAFYQAELMNDFFVAYKIANVTTISDEKLLKMHQNMQINLFQSNVIYMLVKYEENTKQIKILSHSNSVHKFFGYKFEKFKQIDNILPLIPRGIREAHDLLVSQFMIEGQSKYFREINQNLVQMENQYIKPVDFFFEINFSNQNDMTYAVFFIEQSTNNNSYLVVNKNNYITSISQNFFQMLGFKTLKIQQSISTDMVKSQTPTIGKGRKSQLFKASKKLEFFSLIDIQIEYMLPDFDTMIQQIKMVDESNTKNEHTHGTLRFFGQDLYFLKESLVEEISLLALARKDLLKVLKSSWSDTNNLVVYAANLTLNYRTISDHRYVILEIEELKIQKETQVKLKSYRDFNAKHETLRNRRSSLHPSQHMGGSFSKRIIQLVQPISIDHQQKNWSKLFECTDLDIEDEEQVNVPKQMDDDEEISRISQQRISIPNEEQQSQLQILPNQENLDISSPLGPNRRVQDQLFFEVQSQKIFSPKVSIKNFLIPKEQNQKQRFFANEMEQFSESLDDQSSDKGDYAIEQKDDGHSKSQNQDVRDFIMMQLQMEPKENDQQLVQIDDAASLVSSLAGFRKSKFFKKYEIIDKIMLSKKRPKQFSILIALTTLMIAVCATFNFIVLMNVKFDLSRFVKEIDMLEFKANIMGPAYKFTLSQYAWVGYYVDALYFRTITIDQGKLLDQFAIYNINDTYKGLKSNFDNQLSNPYIEEFFTDSFITVGQYSGGIQGLSYRNITFRESLLMWMGLLHDFTVLIDFKQFTIIIDINATYIIYTYVNYLKFIDHFDYMEASIYDYTIQRSQNVNNKQKLSIVPFIIINFVLFCLTFYVYNLYLKNYNRILNVYRLIDPSVLQKDLDRYGIILELLQKDSNIMFKYQFDLDLKESFLMKEDLKKETFQNKKSQGSKKKDKTLFLSMFKMPFYKGLITLLIMNGIFLGYAFLVISMTSNYLVAYEPTAKFYKSLADIEVSICGVYAQREILYLSQIAFYTTNQSKLDYMNQVNINLNNVLQFEQFLSSFQGESSQYLILDNFKETFIHYTTNDICLALPDAYYQQAQLFCNVSMNGVTKRGLLPTLNFMRTSLIYEQNVNNFTSRPTFPFEELEVPLITAQVLTQLKDLLKSGLTSITEDLISTINLITVIFLVYLLLKLIVLNTEVQKFYEKEFQIVKRFLLLLPQNTIFLDTHYERVIRLMIVQDNLV